MIPDTTQLKLAEKILSLFRGRPDVMATQVGDTFRPCPLNAPLTPEQFAKAHFGGNCLGFYLMTEESKVYCACIDLDNHDGRNPNALTNAESIYRLLKENDANPLFEVSQSGEGAHVWLFFCEPIAAGLVRRTLKGAMDEVGIRGEIYPKQDVLTKDTPYGNLVRYPLFGRSVLVGGDTPLACLDAVQPIAEYKLQELENWWYREEIRELQFAEYETQGFPERVRRLLEESPGSLLSRRWVRDASGLSDTSTSALVQSMAVELVRNHVPTPEIISTIQYWCEMNGYQKADQRWIELTVKKAYGYSLSIKRDKHRTKGTLSGLTHRYIDDRKRHEEIIIPSGIRAVDDSVCGLALSEYGIMAARPSNGKSAVGLHWLDTASARGFPGLFVSLEMNDRESARRVMLRVSNTEASKWGDEDYTKILHGQIAQYFANRAPIYFLSDIHHVDEIEQSIEYYVTNKGVKFVCIDYVGLMTTDDRDEYSQQVEISKRLRRLSHKTDCAILSLQQINREWERDGGTPSLRHLRMAGENDADLILVGRWLWKEDANPMNRNVFWFHALKRRNGPINSPTIQVQFDENTQTFR